MNRLNPYRWIRLATFILLIATARSVLAADGPLEQVRTTVGAILEVLSTPDLQLSVKREKISNIISKQFNFREMAQRVLATNWRKTSKEDRKRFVQLFTRLLNQTYLASVESYSSASVKYPGVKIKGVRATVKTIINNNNVKTPINYKLRKNRLDGSWHVYDVVIEGVSLIATYRTEYREIIKNNGVPGLLKQLEKKLSPQAATQQTPAT